MTLLQNVQTVSGNHRPFYTECYGSSFPALKQLEREADHSSPSNTEVKNEWSFGSLSLCLHNKYRNILNFTVYDFAQ
jgi:hypothetical protein